MKYSNKAATAAAAASVVIAILQAPASATVKLDNTTALNVATSWDSTQPGNRPPTATDVAIFNNTIASGPLAVLTGGSLSWKGIQLTNPAGDVTINPTAASNTLAIGTSGIDLSAATANLSLGTILNFNGTQAWSVAASRTLSFAGTNVNATRIGDTAGADVTVTSGSIAGTTATNLAYGNATSAARRASSLSLSGTASYSVATNFQLSSGDYTDSTLNISGSANLSITQALRLGNSGVGTTAVVNQSAGSVTLGTNLTMAAGQTTVANDIDSVYNLNGGTLQSNGISWGNNGLATALQRATINLNGGTFRVAALGQGGTTTTETFNFNGGQLEYSNNVDDTAIFGGANFSTIAVKNGGAKINVLNAPRTMTIANALLATAGSVGGLTKSGPGRLLLQGNNTFIGDTLVSDGTLEIASTGSMRFDINALGDSTSVDGVSAGSSDLAAFNGGFRLDLTDAGSTGSWTLVNSSLSATYGTNFSVSTVGGTMFDEAGVIWTLTQSGTTYAFSETSGILTATSAPEPTTIAAVAFAGLALRRRRRH